MISVSGKVSGAQRVRGRNREQRDRRTSEKQPCPHSCKNCGEFTTRGCGLRTHQSNSRIHDTCSPECEGNTLLDGNEASKDADDSKIPDIPTIPLRVLMVLPSDFDKPKAIGRSKAYETTIPFTLNRKIRLSLDDNIPGFLSHSFFDVKRKLLQVNCWVLLLYFLVNGDSIGEYSHETESCMRGNIISFHEFLAMEGDDDFSPYDIVVGALVGKSEMNGREIDIFSHWKRMEELQEKISFWPCLQEQHRYYSKVQTEWDLHHISKNVTQTGRPFTSMERPSGVGFVAKRTYSSDSLHVVRYNPGMQLVEHPPSAWFFQKFNTLISLVGEVKVIIVEKERVLSRLLCTPVPEGSKAGEHDDMTEAILWAHPLSKLQQLDDEEISLFNDTSRNGPSKEGLEEIDNFCLETLRNLSLIEKRRQTEPLSIDSLARVDIALFRSPDGTLQYYVNEISRPPACGLMEHLAGQTTNIEVMASCVKNGLVRSYRHHCGMYPSISRRHNVSIS